MIVMKISDTLPVLIAMYIYTWMIIIIIIMRLVECNNWT